MSMELSAKTPVTNVLLCLLLSAGVLMVDAWKLPSTLHQWQTRDYLPTRGTITHSQWIEHRGRKGSSSVYEMLYRYEVNGQHHFSDVVTSSPLMSGIPHALDDHFPLNSSLTVYYSPSDPGDCVLLKGLQGIDLLCLLFLFPVHLLLLGLWYACVRGFLRFSDELGTFVRQGRTHVPLSLGLDEGLGFSMAVMFLSLLVCGVTNALPPLWLMGLVWAGVLVGAGVLLGRWWKARRSGAFELVLDERHEWISVPAMFGRPARLQVPLSRLASLRMDTRSQQGPKGGTRVCWMPVLVLAHANGRHESLLLAEWWEDEERAEALMALLRRRLGRVLREAA